MMKSKLITTIIFGIFVSFMFSCLSCSKKKEQPAKEVKKTEVTQVELGDQALGYLVAPNLDKLFSAIDKYSAKIAPFNTKMLLTLSLTQLGMNDISQINFGSASGLLLLNPKEYPQPVIVAVGIQDQKKTIKSLKSVLKEVGQENGIYQFSQEKIDTDSVFAGGADKTPTISTSIYAKFIDKTLYLALDKKALSAKIGLLKNALSSFTATNAAKFVFNVDYLMKTSGQDVEQALDLMKLEMEKGLVATSSQTESTKWFVSWYIDKIKNSLEQILQASLTISFEELTAQLKLELTPKKESFFAKFLASQKHQPLTLIKALPENSFMAAGLNIQYDLIKDDILALASDALDKFLGQKLSAEIKPYMNEAIDVMGEEVAFSQDISQDGMTIVEIFTVKDSLRAQEIYKKLAEQFIDIMSKSDNEAGKLPFTMTKPKTLEKYRNVQIDSFEFSYDMQNMSELEAKAIKSFYGDKTTILSAAFSQRYVIVMGNNALAIIKEVIDRILDNKPGLTESTSFSNAAGEYKTKTGGFLYLSLTNFIKMAMQLSFAGAGPEIRFSPSKSGIFLNGKSSADELTITIRVPADHIYEVKEAISTIGH
jgi:hypothetical protein